MPFFTGYRRSREPEGSGHPSSQVAGASSSSSPAARPAPLLPEQNEMPGSTSEVTMTWNFDALNEGQQVILSNGPGQENAVILGDTVNEPPSPIEPPPNYDVARIPSYPLTYTFSSLGGSSSAMILIPTLDSPDTRPVYHISVGHDPFLPFCFITTVVRGGSGQGEYVGGFKTLHTYPSHMESPTPGSESVTIRGFEYSMPTIFTKGKRKGVCYKRDDDTKPLARFTPTEELMQKNKPFPEAKLEIMPIGHARFDDILISVLILERNRRVSYY
ncbi:hypothetical protein CVT25_002546 [Psilocybe cyanescens]|uniref:Uncharacterized protein n=1 Tax=Psilocybe cyanescens TaxID=93625 RepID=A0A409XUH0_PSICY|nr:hypothetical protein CVT25_002546 [Psilocybe cyanescens]